MDPAPAGGCADRVQRDARVLHGGAPDVAQLLDARGRQHDPREHQVPLGEHGWAAGVQDAHAAHHQPGGQGGRGHVQVRGQEPARRNRRQHPPLQ